MDEKSSIIRKNEEEMHKIMEANKGKFRVHAQNLHAVIKSNLK